MKDFFINLEQQLIKHGMCNAMPNPLEPLGMGDIWNHFRFELSDHADFLQSELGPTLTNAKMLSDIYCTNRWGADLQTASKRDFGYPKFAEHPVVAIAWAEGGERYFLIEDIVNDIPYGFANLGHDELAEHGKIPLSYILDCANDKHRWVQPMGGAKRLWFMTTFRYPDPNPNAMPKTAEEMEKMIEDDIMSVINQIPSEKDILDKIGFIK